MEFTIILVSDIDTYQVKNTVLLQEPLKCAYLLKMSLPVQNNVTSPLDYDLVSSLQMLVT